MRNQPDGNVRSESTPKRSSDTIVSIGCDIDQGEKLHVSGRRSWLKCCRWRNVLNDNLIGVDRIGHNDTETGSEAVCFVGGRTPAVAMLLPSRECSLRRIGRRNGIAHHGSHPPVSEPDILTGKDVIWRSDVRIDDCAGALGEVVDASKAIINPLLEIGSGEGFELCMW
jgi:hypothetical protein